MTDAPQHPRARAIALPREALSVPGPVTEWIVASIAVLLLLAGLVF
jgi:hypothetical protein